MTKLVKEDIPLIRELYHRYGLTQSEIAEKFEVSRSCIKHALNFSNWHHIKGSAKDYEIKK